MVWGSVIPVAYGLLQACQLDPFVWDTDGSATIISTFGRSNFFGAYLMLVFPLTLGRWQMVSNRWPYSLLLLAQLTCLALTQAKAAWLGAIISLSIFGGVWIRQHKKQITSQRHVIFGRVMVAGFFISILLFTTTLPTDFVENDVLQHLLSLIDPTAFSEEVE